jgi:hypothetical protein
VLTVIVPVIWTGWIMQWYGYTPALLNVKVYVSPFAKGPESKTLESEVAVCVIWPVFVQQTVVPVGIVMSAGSKKLSPMLISVEPAGQPVGT